MIATGAPDSRSFIVSLDREEDYVCDPSEAPPVLHIAVPEMFNIALQASDAAITFRNKIMGDVSVCCTSGSVIIDQLRGEHINLQCNDGEVI